ncbi:MAG: 4Fe-4S dicluster domain-containing protein [Tannerellaceae bacterium]|jgi:epoxyqueuosine reductase QueG|nr:4Fe-4S dicluster domain-containing protein [Tannerellaceae bacterium]
MAANLKQQIARKAHRLGAALTGFAPVARWEEFGETREELFPHRVFPFTQTVVVLAVPIFIPMLDTTPSIVYSELYNTTNRVLDDMAYRLALFLNEKGQRAVFFPRDGYGDISVLLQNPEAGFSHVLAAKYAGLGTVGYNHTLLTPEYGPRLRFVSVLTDAAVAPDPMQEKELCLGCKRCQKFCPTASFTPSGHRIAEMDKHRCAEYHEQLKREYCYPCGVCIKVCPVGTDRTQYP